MSRPKKKGKCAICGRTTSTRWYPLTEDLIHLVKFTSERYKHICELDYTRTRNKDVPIVSRSTIPHAGNGLFADRDYKWNEIITYYDGKVYSPNEPLPSNKSYFKGCGRYIIDGRVNFGDGLGRYINCPKRGSKANARWGFAGVGTRVAIRAMRKPKGCKNPIAIKAGEEIFICYGSGYWASHKKWKMFKRRRDTKILLRRRGLVSRKYK